MRVALVSGGLGGIGSEICRALADDGLRVVALDLPAEDTRVRAFHDANGTRAISLEYADVADHAAAQAAVRRIEADIGAISVLVNAAGITRDALLRKMDLAQWQDVLRVNLDGVFNLCKPVIDGMCARGFGRIVNISSINGQTGQFGQTNYAAAKAGMHGFTMSLAKEVARFGVTVNSISPGYIRTPMTEAIPERIRGKILADIPVGRMGEPEDIARAVRFLCSEDSGYLTGVNLPVNGGLFVSF